MPPEVHARIIADAFVMVAGDEHDTGALAGLAQQLLQHVVMGLRPHGPALDAPEIYNVANEVDGLGVVVLKEVEEHGVLGSTCAEMHIRDEQRAV